MYYFILFSEYRVSIWKDEQVSGMNNCDEHCGHNGCYEAAHLNTDHHGNVSEGCSSALLPGE